MTAYEYVPDTEEASDSFMSSLDAASPKPPADSDSEMATVTKEFVEEFQKIHEKMEIEIDEAKETPQETQQVEIQVVSVETVEDEVLEEAAPITHEEEPEEAKPTEVKPESVKPEEGAPVQSIAETIEEVVEVTEVMEVPSEVLEEGPLFLAPLADTTVMEKATIRFEVTFSGTPIKVTWYLDGEEVKPSEDIEILTKERHSTLLIKEALPEDEGEYWVEVVNKSGSAKSTAYLHVQGELYFLLLEATAFC